MALFRRRREAQALGRDAQPLTANGDNAKGSGCGVLFGIAFGTFGMVFVAMFLLLPLWQVARAQSWNETPCTIQESHVETHADSDGDTYSVAVRYTFQAPDPAAAGSEAPMRTWTGDRYSFVTGSSSGRGAKQEAVDRNPTGARRVCWVDPRDPRHSVLERGITGDMWFGAFTLIFPLAGYGIALGVWLSARRRRQRERILSAGARQVPASGNAPGDVLRPGSGQSPWGTLIASLVIGAIWNGALAAIILGSFLPVARNGVPLWVGIFFLPFVLIGLALLVWVGYNLLALANPRLRLRSDVSTLRPGGRAELSWDLNGPTGNLRRLTVTLEGREEATYTRGTNQVTDKEVFFSAVLFDSDNRRAMQQGRCALAIPADAPASLEARHNRLRWVVVVHGDIPRWPDIQAEWELVVQPPLAPVPAAPLALAGDTSATDDQTLAIVLGASADSHVAGTVVWDLPEVPTLLELRLFWYTTGRGTMDVAIADQQRLASVPARGRQGFDLTLPHGPRPFAGKLVAITWALELVAEPGGRVARLELPHLLPLVEWGSGRPIRSV